MDIFNECEKINELILAKNEVMARNELIKLLDYHKKNEIEYSPLLNHLVRETGLYPYLNVDTALWQDRFVYEVFKVDIGGKKATLHREQSSLLKRLINGENIAVSAPTSFGKSFVIDAFIAIREPKNVVIIVPTIALTDETRRRLYKKFANKYKIITTTDVELSKKNIFIFPQERAVKYVNKIESVDILIIDEFYKASSDYDKERSPSLLKAIIKLGQKAKQKYFLAPNIAVIKDNIFTKDMIFEDKLDFNTVYLQRFDYYKEIENDESKKGKTLLKILNETQAKSLIYAASYPQIEKVSNLLNENRSLIEKSLLLSFADWLNVNYDSNWKLTNLIKRGIGIHNGQLHRSLSQIQVKLFEEVEGIDSIISTSSIIEGVNTSAENVIIWKNRKGGRGNAKLDDFTYKNIIGRGSRMFKHFVGKIYLLEEPPSSTTTQLDINFPDNILGDIDENIYKESLTNEQIQKIHTYKQEMDSFLGKGLLMKTTAAISFDQKKLNVTSKTRSNIFNWRGQFTPEFVEYIINTFAKDTKTILDPFCGSGTVLLESARHGIASIGFEINPAAYAMARFISLATLSQADRKRLCDSLKEHIVSLISVYQDLPLFEPESTFRRSYKNLNHFAGELLSKLDNKNEKVIALACLFHAESSKRDSLGVTISRSLEIVTAKLSSLPFTQKSIVTSLCDARMSHLYLNTPIDLIITNRHGFWGDIDL